MPSVRPTVLAALAAWHGLAAAKNLCELLAAFARMSRLAPLGSGNLPAMERLLAPLRLPRPALAVLLAGVVGMESGAAVLFARGDHERAFVLALVLFTAFVLIDDAFREYRLDETHRGILTLLLVAYLVVRDHTGD